MKNRAYRPTLHERKNGENSFFRVKPIKFKSYYRIIKKVFDLGLDALIKNEKEFRVPCFFSYRISKGGVRDGISYFSTITVPMS